MKSIKINIHAWILIFLSFGVIHQEALGRSGSHNELYICTFNITNLEISSSIVRNDSNRAHITSFKIDFTIHNPSNESLTWVWVSSCIPVEYQLTIFPTPIGDYDISQLYPCMAAFFYYELTPGLNEFHDEFSLIINDLDSPNPPNGRFSLKIGFPGSSLINNYEFYILNGKIIPPNTFQFFLIGNSPFLAIFGLILIVISYRKLKKCREIYRN